MSTATHEPSRRRVITLIILGTLVWAAGPLLVLVEQQRPRGVAVVEPPPADVVPTAVEPAPPARLPDEVEPPPLPDAEAGAGLVPASTTVAPPAAPSEPVSG